MNPSLILGVDPGAGGALALYDPDTHEARIMDMPTHRSLRGGKARKDIDGYELGMLIDSVRHQLRRACVEQVSSRPGQASQFQFGDNYGVLKGVLYANLIPITFAPPSVWKPAKGLVRKPDQTKAHMKTQARKLATQMFPQLTKELARVKDDGRAESLLLAVYGAKHEYRN